MTDPMQPAQVDVVILSWNDGQMLWVAVESALLSENVAVRVIVVDNGSTEEPVAPRGQEVTLIRNPVNRGVAAGRNQGIAVGQAPYVLLLDSDAALRPSALRELLDPLLDEETIGLTVPRYEGQALTAGAGKAPTLVRKVVRAAGLTDQYTPNDSAGSVLDVDFGIGACQLFRRDAWKAVGGIDERYFYGPEDVDFCLRVKQAGWRVVQVTEAVCVHPARRRNRKLISVKGIRHAGAVLRFLARHRLWW